MTTGQVARYCQVSHVTVLKWIKEEDLPAYTIPSGHYRIERAEFKRFLERHGMPIYEDFFGRSTRRILVVDDEPEVVDVIVKALRKDAGYEFETAADGFEAGLKLATFKPDLIILDLMMPWVDGFELCRSVKETPDTAHVKILVVTGYLDSVNVERALALGADDYLAKPLPVAELRAKVAALLGSNRR